MKTRPAYVIGQLSVKDYAGYIATYGASVFEQIKAAGAEILAAAREVRVLEGEWHYRVIQCESHDPASSAFNLG